MAYDPFSAAMLALPAVAATVLIAALLWRLRQMRAALDQAQAAQAAVDAVRYFRDLVVDSASDGLVVTEMNGVILWANPAFCQMLGYPLDTMLGRNPLSFCPPPDQRLSPEQIAAFRYDQSAPDHSRLAAWQNVRANGDLFWNQISVSFRDAPNGDMHAVLVCRDVTDQVESEAKLRQTTAQLEQTVAHDGLTSIPNRATLVARCAAMLACAAETGTRVGMLQIDIDHFKEINDTKGHIAGDAVLIHVANMLAGQVRDGDVVARVGGDEFIMVCRDVQGLPELCEIGERLAQSLSEPLIWRNNRVAVRLSIGAALSQPCARDPEELIQHADFALYEVKRTGRGRVAPYDERLHQRHMTLTRRSAELSEAVAAGGLEYHFQPVVNWPTARLLGFETLVRWRHPTGGLIPPGDFLGMASDMGLMPEIDLAAMRAGVDMKLALARLGLPRKVISFNASAEGLLHRDYLGQLRDLTARHSLDPGQLTVEVLETIMFDDQMSMSAHADVISAITALGYKTVLDDFGVGHAGLAHLAKLSLTGVKIDRSLISMMLSEKASGRIVATVLDLCSDLGLDVIGEGVETDDIATALADIGCQIMQGFGIGRPMPQAAALAWAQAYASREPPLARQRTA